ncbi:MAG: PD-(D/E)XK nuclease family protein [Bacteroides sp.]|nr:PD-(D/E)XK nuclease family protein [Prevotella sp.]MCM1408083.1 PD-(D/E)XK nuclease family protein [Treponema brennaborense]MCM1469059.1 PD-(D/E)XK nuclease family protein [Bacteroides sp.]
MNNDNFGAEQIIKEHISNSDVFFVFQSEIAAVLWAEKMLTSGCCGAVALERFIAWDTFKANFIRSSVHNKQSVPAVVKRLFAQHLLAENARAAAAGKPLFKSLIHPRYAGESRSFSDWIASLLPSLAGWREQNARAAGRQNSNKEKTSPVIDDEDCDLLLLYNRYAEFLESHKLFEPAWEKPPFYDDGNTYIIFFPEILQDYAEYREILSKQKNIRQIPIPFDKNLPCAALFDNARSELRNLALHIRHLHEEQNIPYENIALNVPDSENMLPYITRELSLYAVPFAVKNGKSLADYAAGQLFGLMQSCVQNQFSFQSLKNLFLNRRFPWNAQTEDAVSQLIDFGIKNDCLCSWHEHESGRLLDVWETAFARSGMQEQRALELYRQIKNVLNAICSAPTFAALRAEYFSFREKFFDVKLFSEERFAEADRIISRCLSELAVLVEMETAFPSVRAENCFGFFVNELRGKIYLAQSTVRGVNIFPYKLAASAPFDCHIVINASQNALSVVYKPFPFLSKNKRKQLQFEDINVSEQFIRLYAMNTSALSGAYFSCSSRTFGGYALPHSCLAVQENSAAAELSADLYTAEREALPQLFSAVAENRFPEKLFSVQKKSFFEWAAAFRNERHENFAGSGNTAIRNRIDSLRNGGLIRVSATMMNEFFSCPRMWFFSRILGISDFSQSASSFDVRLRGTILHEIIHRMLERIKLLHSGVLPLPCAETESECSELAKEIVREVLDGFPQTCAGIKNASFLTAQLYAARKPDFMRTAAFFANKFLENFGGYKILALEKKYTIPFAEDSFLVGQIDCVLCNTDGNPAIVDFKQKNAPRRQDCICAPDSEMRNFQLAMYIKLLEQTEYHGKKAVQEALFFSIEEGKAVYILGNPKKTARGKNSDEEQTSLSPRDSFEPSMKFLDESIDYFISSVKAGRLSLPNAVPYDVCAACAYAAVCRTTFAISGESSWQI